LSLFRMAMLNGQALWAFGIIFYEK